MLRIVAAAWGTFAGRIVLLVVTAGLLGGGMVIFKTISSQSTATSRPTTAATSPARSPKAQSDLPLAQPDTEAPASSATPTSVVAVPPSATSNRSPLTGSSTKMVAGKLANPTTTVTATNAPATTTIAPSASPAGFQSNCYVTPSVCGYPDANNTGVPAGTTLTNSGSITITQDGAVINGLNVSGQIVVNANNVTIKNTRITSYDYYPIDYSGHTGLLIEDSEIAGTADTVTAGLSFDSYTIRRANIHGSADGFKANANVIIEDSYIHNLAVTANSHNDGVQSTGGSNVTLRHNTFNVGTAGDCVQFGPSDTAWLVTNNLFNCTGWMLNGSNGTVNSTFTNNRFTRLNGAYGPASLGGPGNTWSGNFYDNDNATANL